MAARKTKLNNFQSRKALYKLSDCDNSLHETFRNASVTRPPQPAVPLTRPIECRPVGGRASGSDVVTRVNDSTRVTIFSDSDSTRVTLSSFL